MCRALSACILAAATAASTACVSALPGGSLGEPPDGAAAGAGTGNAPGMVIGPGTGGGGISGAVPGAGGSPSDPLVLVTMAGWPNNLAADSRFLYWGDKVDQAVMKIPLAGGPATAIAKLPPTVSFAWLAVDDESVYFAVPNSNGSNDLVKASIGGGPTTTIFSGSEMIEEMTAGGGFVYWSTISGKLLQVRRSGGAPALISADHATGPILADAGNVYWFSPSSGSIMRTAAGTGQSTELVAAAGAVGGLAIDATDIYWINLTASAVMKAALADGTPETIAVTPGAAGYLAVDTSGVYWTNQSGQVFGVEPPAGVKLIADSKPGSLSAFGIALGPSNVYWLRVGAEPIFRAPK